MRPQKHILVVEDEADLADLLVYNFKRAGFDARAVYTGADALRQVAGEPPDVMVLDVMLPELSGLEVARIIRTDPRTAGLPILMLTAKAEDADEIAGLSAGADDYVTKPFSVKVLLARVEALLRRAEGAGRIPEVLEIADLRADLADHSVTVQGRAVRLTLTEFKLLVALMQSMGRALSRAHLMSRVMGPDVVVTARTIDVHVAALRRKLGAAGDMIRTVRGVGYLLSREPIEDGDADAEIAEPAAG